MNALAPIGHNIPPLVDPEILDREAKRVATFCDAAGDWLDLREIDSAEKASELEDFISGCRKAWTEIDGTRKANKKPHDDAAAAVQKAFAPLLDKLEKAAKSVAPMKQAWLKKEQLRLQAEQAERQRLADEAAQRARDELAAAEARNDVAGMADAEAAQKEAADAAKAAARPVRATVTSATGGGRASGLRTTRVAVINNMHLAFREVMAEPRVVDAVQSALNAIVRSAEFGANPRKIPGVTVETKET